MRGLRSEMNQKVLVVDDDESNRFSLAALLEDEGFEVEVASSYAEAEQKLLTGDPQYSLVLLDQRLGDGLGTDLVPTVRARLPRAKVVLLTGGYAVRDTPVDAVIQKGGSFPVMMALLSRLTRLTADSDS